MNTIIQHVKTFLSTPTSVINANEKSRLYRLMMFMALKLQGNSRRIIQNVLNDIRKNHLDDKGWHHGKACRRLPKSLKAINKARGRREAIWKAKAPERAEANRWIEVDENSVVTFGNRSKYLFMDFDKLRILAPEIARKNVIRREINQMARSMISTHTGNFGGFRRRSSTVLESQISLLAREMAFRSMPLRARILKDDPRWVLLLQME